MTKVKICGLTSMEDIETVNEYLPDFAGFVFCPSKRRVDIKKARELCSLLDGRIKSVGVFVNQTREEVERVAYECGLNIIQLHGDEKPEECRYEGLEVWKAIRIREENDIEIMDEYPADRFVLDSYSKSGYGGSGHVFDWSIAKGLRKNGKIILAGGLSAENVGSAIEALDPYAVDVSSGVETEGKKDRDKIREFIAKARGLYGGE